MVRTFAVTSSPVVPSPRVAARTSRPSRYCSAMLRPSIFSSATYGTGPSKLSSPRRSRSSNAFSSSSLYALSRLSIGSAWRTDAKFSAGRPPTRWVGESSGDEIGMIALEVLELAQQRIELGVGDLRRGLDVVALFVMADLLAELVDAGRWIHGGS